MIGRFGGFWLLERYDWTSVMAACGVAILLCFACAIFGGRSLAIITLPLSGLFMSVIYPALNSKGIILFVTCVSAVVAPLAMGLIGEYMGDAIYGFYLATRFAAVLAIGLILNRMFAPASAELRQRGQVDYQN